MSLFGDWFRITFKYLLEIISPIVGWCSSGTFTNPCIIHPSIESYAVDWPWIWVGVSGEVWGGSWLSQPLWRCRQAQQQLPKVSTGVETGQGKGQKSKKCSLEAKRGPVLGDDMVSGKISLKPFKYQMTLVLSQSLFSAKFCYQEGQRAGRASMKHPLNSVKCCFPASNVWWNRRASRYPPSFVGNLNFWALWSTMFDN